MASVALSKHASPQPQATAGGLRFPRRSSTRTQKRDSSRVLGFSRRRSAPSFVMACQPDVSSLSFHALALTTICTHSQDIEDAFFREIGRATDEARSSHLALQDSPHLCCVASSAPPPVEPLLPSYLNSHAEQVVADSLAKSDGRRRRLLLGDPLSDALDATHIVDGLWDGDSPEGSASPSGATGGAHEHAPGEHCGSARCGGAEAGAPGPPGRDKAALVLWLSTSGGAASGTGADVTQARGAAHISCALSAFLLLAEQYIVDTASFETASQRVKLYFIHADAIPGDPPAAPHEPRLHRRGPRRPHRRPAVDVRHPALRPVHLC